jgi:hypothetical protein
MKIRFIVKEQTGNPQDVAQNLPSDEQEATQTRESLRTTMDQLDLNTLDTTQMKALQGFISGLQNNMSERKKEDPVSKKIRMLRDEGKPQKQAVAIALDMKERGKLKEKK